MIQGSAQEQHTKEINEMFGNFAIEESCECWLECRQILKSFQPTVKSSVS